MSTKKDKFSKKDRFYMNLAFNLAREREGLTGENPSVGCVIVKNDQIISTGQTGYNGRPHAEFNAIKSCQTNLEGSTIYISLEPCTHHGKTPPCSNLIIKSKIKKVIFSILDVDQRTAGKSFKILRNKNIIVKSGLLKIKGSDIYKAYKFNKLKKLPFVTGKLAVSNDHFVYSKKRNKITNKHSNNITHLLRYKNDSILISSKTLNIDNPKLNCRINGLENFSPKRIILDRELNINKKSYIYLNSNKKNTIIFYNKASKQKIQLLKKKGFNLVKIRVNKNNLFDLKMLLKMIYFFGCRNLLVEGGKKLTNSFINDKLFNEFYLFRSPTNLNSSGKLNVSRELHQLNFNYKNRCNINSYTGNDIIKIYS